MAQKQQQADNHQCGTDTVSVGRYLVERLIQAGVNNCFTVPGDFILTLLDEINREKELNLMRCGNELNAGYAADRSCRASGKMSVLAVTYMVGSLSALNAVAGAFAEDLPMLVVVGGPNSNDRERCHLVHHTIGEPDFYRSAQCYQPVTAGTFTVRYIREAAKKIDDAVRLCLVKRKPVYLEIACNLFTQQVGSPQPAQLVPEVPVLPDSDEISLHAAIESIAYHINRAEKVVLIAGSRLRAVNGIDHFVKFAQALGCPVAVMPDAKGMFSEHDENFIGCYWGSLSDIMVQKAVDSADLVICCGPIFSDFVTVGWTTTFPQDKSIVMAVDHAHVCGKRFSFICLSTLLNRLASSVPKKTNFMAIDEEEKADVCHGQHPLESALTLSFLQEELQLNVASDKYGAVLVETGDAWFIAEKLKIPPDTSFHIQMQYGSIGWAMGALVGVGQVGRQAGFGKVLALIGDGSFQVSPQELSTMISEDLDITIVLLNNGSYSTEEQIHGGGEYNKVVRWKYAQLMGVFGGVEPSARSYLALTNGELKQALSDSVEHHGVALIECMLDKDDCTEELRHWGQKIAEANCRA